MSTAYQISRCDIQHGDWEQEIASISASGQKS